MRPKLQRENQTHLALVSMLCCVEVLELKRIVKLDHLLRNKSKEGNTRFKSKKEIVVKDIKSVIN
jgi:hypothetical protein